MLRKIFNMAVSSLTLVWSLGLYALVPAVVHAADCPTLSAGNLFKVPNSSAVYLLNSNMERMYFPHASVYKTWYADYSSVKEIPNTCVDNYPAPSAPPFGVNYRPGSRLVKVQISPSVYVVEPGNKIRKIGSEAVAKALYGDDWASEVADVADVFWPNYVTKGADLNEAVPHNGMLVKALGDDTVYEIKDGKRYEVEGAVRGEVQIISEQVLDSIVEAGSLVSSDSVYDDPSQLETEEEILEEEETQTEEISVSNKRITVASGESVRPSIAWNGENYGLVWSDTRNGENAELFFIILDEAGNKVGSEVKLTNTPDLISTNPEIIWGGDQFVVVYSEYSEVLATDSTVKLLRVSKDGVKIGNETMLANIIDKANPDLAYDGSGFGVIWRTPNNSSAKTYFSYVNKDGIVVKNQVRVLSDEASDQTEIVWDGSKFGIVYRQGVKKLGYGDSASYTVGTYLYRVDQNGDATRPSTFITGKEAYAAAWDGQNYVAAEDNKTFSRFDRNANMMFTNKIFSADGLGSLDIINDGTKYGIVGERSGKVYFVEGDFTGAVTQAEMKLSDFANTSLVLPRVGWSGNKYAVVWSDGKDENNGGEIYFRAVSQ